MPTPTVAFHLLWRLCPRRCSVRAVPLSLFASMGHAHPFKTPRAIHTTPTAGMVLTSNRNGKSWLLIRLISRFSLEITEKTADLVNSRQPIKPTSQPLPERYNGYRRRFRLLLETRKSWGERTKALVGISRKVTPSTQTRRQCQQGQTDNRVGVGRFDLLHQRDATAFVFIPTHAVAGFVGRDHGL